jgi:hypothetical protein
MKFVKRVTDRFKGVSGVLCWLVNMIDSACNLL